MASPTANAIRQQNALDRLKAAMNHLARDVGVAPAALPTHGHDPELLRAQQFEVLADWTEAVVERLKPGKPGSYVTRSTADLAALYGERKLSGAAEALSRQQLIAALNADDKRRIEGKYDEANP